MSEEEMASEIESLKRALLRLIACLAVELGSDTAKSLIAEITFD